MTEKPTWRSLLWSFIEAAFKAFGAAAGALMFAGVTYFFSLLFFSGFVPGETPVLSLLGRIGVTSLWAVGIVLVIALFLEYLWPAWGRKANKRGRDAKAANGS